MGYRGGLASEMAANRPMITLQYGNYANYIGAHFWNLQVAKLLMQATVTVDGL